MRGAFNHWITTMGLLGGFALLLSGCGQTQPTTPINPNQLDSRGGTIRSNDEKASLQIPGQTLSGAVVFSLAPSNQTVKAPADKVLVSGTMYALSSTPSTTLAKPSTLSIQYDPALVEGLGRKLGVSSQAAANTLEIARLANGAWVPVGGSSADPNASTVQAPITEMGIYTLLAPDGSKPVWRLEVRGGIGAIGNNINEVQPIAEAINRNYLYISLSRNGQVPTSPVALHVSGPNGYNTTLPYAEGRNWGIFGLATRQAGLFTLRFSADGQDISSTVDITATPTLPLPIISAQVVSGLVETRWEPIATAQSYEVRLYGPTLSVVQTLQTKNTNANLTIPSNLIGQNIAVMVLAYTWDNTLERTQPYPTVLEKTNASASLVAFSQSGNPSNPGGQPNLINLIPGTLYLSAATNSIITGVVNFTNTGSGALDFTTNLSGTGFRVTSGNTGSVPSFGGMAQVVIEGTCGTSATPRAGSLTINSNDPDTPVSTVQLQLECLPTLSATQRLFRAGHVGQVSTLVGSPSGGQIASRDSSRVMLWNATNGRVSHLIETSNSCCSSDGGAMAYSPDSTRLAAITNSGSLIRVFSTSTGTEQLAISGLNSYVGLVWNLAGTRIAAINSSNQVAVYDSTSGANLAQYAVGSPNFYSTWGLLGFNNDGTRLLLTSAYTVRVVDANTGTQTSTYDIPYNNFNIISGIALLPGNTQIVTIAYTGTGSEHRFDVRTATTGQLVRSFGSYNPPSSFTTVGFLASPDGSRVALAEFSQPGGSSSVRIWEVSTGTLTRTITPPIPDSISVSRLTWVGTGSLALAYPDGMIRTFSTSTGSLESLFGYHSGAVSSLDFNSTNTQILSGTGGGSRSSGSITLAWANFVNDTTTHRLYESGNGALAARWYSSDTRIAAVTSTQSGALLLRSYDAISGAQLSSVSLPNLARPLFSPDGTRLLYTNDTSYSSLTSVTVVNSPGGGNPVNLIDLAVGSNGTPNWTFSWSADSRRIFGAANVFSTGDTVAVWDAATGARINSIRLLPANPNFSSSCGRFAFSADGRRVICSSSFSSSTLMVFDAINGTQVGEFTRETANGSIARFEPDGTGNRILLALGNRLEVVTTSGAVLGTIRLAVTPPNNGQAVALAWSPNGRFVSMGDDSGSLYIWEFR